MQPYWQSDNGDTQLTIYQGDVLDVLRRLPPESVHCCITSPPYWGLRDYGVDGQIGLEPTPEEYVEKLVAVFREVRRVLRSDGTLWLNLGDSYAGSWGNYGAREGQQRSRISERWHRRAYEDPRAGWRGLPPTAKPGPGLKPKDLIGVPWAVAFALRDDGWVLRSDIVWAKANPMPESVTDRPTKSHEFVFLFSKARWTGDYPPRTMSASDARWLALLIETEGNIVIRRYTHGRKQPQHAVQVAVANSDRAILEEARRIAGGGTILVRGGKNRNVYYLQWTTKAASRILWECLPYLFGKRQQALCALFLESRRNNSNKSIRCDIYEKDGRHYRLTQDELALRDRLWGTIKALNQHQPIDTSWIPEPREGRWVPNRYYYDADAIREPLSSTPEEYLRAGKSVRENHAYGSVAGRPLGSKSFATVPAGRNKRSVWWIATEPFPEAHFATFPTALVEPMILAGTSSKACPHCGAPWERVVEASGGTIGRDWNTHSRGANDIRIGHTKSRAKSGGTYRRVDKGFRPTCACSDNEGSGRCVVLDPFLGSGTTLLVAQRLGRSGIGIELNPDYCAMAQRRLEREHAQTRLPVGGGV